MKASLKRSIIAALACTLSAFAVASYAADPACKPVFDAMTKMAGTPSHQYMTENAAFNAGPESSEVITTSIAMYVKAAGSWHRSDYNPQQAMDELREAVQSKRTACKYLRDDTVNGEAVALYDTRDEQDGGSVIDSQLWISKARGLPLKQTIDIDVGGKKGKSHRELRIDYTGVQAPAGVR